MQELEQQLADVRAHYQRKVRSLQMQLDAASGHPPTGSSSGRHDDAQPRADSAPGARAGAHCLRSGLPHRCKHHCQLLNIAFAAHCLHVVTQPPVEVQACS